MSQGTLRHKKTKMIKKTKSSLSAIKMLSKIAPNHKLATQQMLTNLLGQEGF